VQIKVIEVIIMAASPIPVNERVALSPQQAADILGIAKRTLQPLIDSGELPSFLMGSRRLITRVALEEAVRRREERYTAAARGSAGKINR